MQSIVIEKPYQFVPPSRSDTWAKVLGRILLRRYLDKAQGVVDVKLLGVDRLQASVDAGHGIMLTPNHCRPSDPMAVLYLGRAVGRPLYTMASWHLFMQSRFATWILRHMGVFSVYREGMDRESLKCAVQILAEARRPLVVFPEGVISRTNDRVNHLMDGVAFMARTAAKQRAGATPPGKVVIHPVAIRYFFGGDLESALAPVLEQIERRLSWRPWRDGALPDRIFKIGSALLTLKELEYFGKPQAGELRERLQGLIDHLLGPLEVEWLKERKEGSVVARVKNLRAAILPELVSGELAEQERSRRWRQLADLYLAQQLFFYPPGYFSPQPTPERLLETVERFEEDLTDVVTVHRPVRAVLRVGEAIEVSATRERGGEGDPVMQRVRSQLETMLEDLRQER
jgi:hypothetical protein